MTVGLLICSFNDLELSKVMYPSLVKSMPSHIPYGIVVVDGGSTDGSLEFWKSKAPVIHPGDSELLKRLNAEPGDLRHLSRSLNIGGKYLMASGEYSHILHPHPDMEFPQEGWVDVMVKYLKKEPKIAKLSADWDHLRMGDREGNQCPWIMPVSVIKEMIEDDGYWFDPEFRGIGGSEDWDLNCRLINKGYRVTITSDAIVEHEGMGTRGQKGRDTNQDALYNRGYYVSKWGTHMSPV